MVSPSPEEDDGVSEPVSLAVEADLVHQCIGRNLVVRRARHFSSSQDGIPKHSNYPNLVALDIVNEVW